MEGYLFYPCATYVDDQTTFYADNNAYTFDWNQGLFQVKS